MDNSPLDSSFFTAAINLVRSAQQKINRQINLTMVQTYFDIGKMIVENEQKGDERAEYGTQLITKLSQVLTEEFGSGFSKTNLRQICTVSRVDVVNFGLAICCALTIFGRG